MENEASHNKDHRITILLDGTAEDDVIKELFEISFDLTDRKGKRHRTA